MFDFWEVLPLNLHATYLCIDLKSFYASVECVERGLDPLTTNLVVADRSRTKKTICLAVSPALKMYGIPGRPRLFEVEKKVTEINASRKEKAPYHCFLDSSYDAIQLQKDATLSLDYITATPRMALYLEYSTKIYGIYLNYIAPEDMHVYSIDEVFFDVTTYLELYQMTAHELAMRMIKEVFRTTGITATAGIGTNMYLCKVAMDIVAKHTKPDKDGVRIAELDEMSYRKQLWIHQPITDFWRVGKGYSKKLAQVGLYTMGDIAKCSIGEAKDFYNEELLYQLFGVNAELLIDHAWGWEPCTMAEVKSYKPSNHSVGSAQVLHCPYCYEKAKLVTKEMADLLVFDLVDKSLVTDQLVLTVSYDIENISSRGGKESYKGAVKTDHYGRTVPKHAHGTINLDEYTSSSKLIVHAMIQLYERIVNKNLLIRRIHISANHVKEESQIIRKDQYVQLDLFIDYEKFWRQQREKEKDLKRERKLQEAVLEIKKKYGKNAVLKGMNLEKGATAMDRNRQIGGHKA